MRQFGKIYHLLGILISTMSFVMLIWHGFKVGWAAPLRAILQWYDGLVGFVFRWPEEWIRTWIAQLNALIGWHLHLNPQWKHVFILMSFYFLSLTKMHVSKWYSDADYEVGHRHIVLYTIWTVVLSLVTGIAVGLLLVSEQTATFYSDLSLVFVVALAASVFWLFLMSLIYDMPWISSLAYRTYRGPISKVRMAVVTLGLPIALIVLVQILFSRPIHELGSSSLAFLLIFIVFLAMNWFLCGALYTLLKGPSYALILRGQFEPRKAWQYFLNNGLTQAGVTMMSAIFAALAIVCANVGLKFAGL